MNVKRREMSGLRPAQGGANTARVSSGLREVRESIVGIHGHIRDVDGGLREGSGGAHVARVDPHPREVSGTVGQEKAHLRRV